MVEGEARAQTNGHGQPHSGAGPGEAAARAKLLARRIKRLYTARFKAEEKIRRAEELIREAMAIIGRALEEAGDAEAVGEKLARGG